MSGDTGSSNNVMTIEFNQAAYRGLGGLGFNIRGGKDFPFISGDSGIFVTKIRDKGAVANLRQNEKRLEPGDRLLEINGQSLEDVYHEVMFDRKKLTDHFFFQEAVRIIGSAKQYDRVVLKFIPISKDKKKYQIMKQFDPQPYSQVNSSNKPIIFW